MDNYRSTLFNFFPRLYRGCECGSMGGCECGSMCVWEYGGCMCVWEYGGCEKKIEFFDLILPSKMPVSTKSAIIHTQPCFNKFRLGKCDYEHTTCVFNHEACIHGDTCPFQFCGYHTPKDGKTLLYYFKLWQLEQLHHKRENINHIELYFEIQEFINLMWDIRTIFENHKNLKSITKSLRDLHEYVSSFRFYNVRFFYINPHLPTRYLLDQIRKDRDVQELVDEFYQVATRELRIAQTFLNKISNNAYKFEWEGKEQKTYSEWINGSDQTPPTSIKQPRKTSLKSWSDGGSLRTDETSEESFEEAFPTLN